MIAPSLASRQMGGGTTAPVDWGGRGGVAILSFNGRGATAPPSFFHVDFFK